MSSIVPVSDERAVLNATQVKEQMRVVQELMRFVLKEGEHYMTIPGTGTKPSLLQNGADKILMTFHLHPEIRQTRTVDEHGIVFYTVSLDLIHNHSEIKVGSGVATCNSGEEKFAWQKAICDEQYQEADPKDRRLKFRRSGSGHTREQQIRTVHYDIEQTLLSMAIKRAKVQATKTAVSVGDIFTVDIEDMDINLIQSSSATAPPPSGDGTMEFTEFNPPELDSEGKIKRGSRRKFYVFKFQGDTGAVESTSFNLPKTPDGLVWSLEEVQNVVGQRLKPTFHTTVSKGKRYINLTHLDFADAEGGTTDDQPDAVELEAVEG